MIISRYSQATHGPSGVHVDKIRQGPAEVFEQKLQDACSAFSIMERSGNDTSLNVGWSWRLWVVSLEFCSACVCVPFHWVPLGESLHLFLISSHKYERRGLKYDCCMSPITLTSVLCSLWVHNKYLSDKWMNRKWTSPHRDGSKPRKFQGTYHSNQCEALKTSCYFPLAGNNQTLKGCWCFRKLTYTVALPCFKGKELPHRTKGYPWHLSSFYYFEGTTMNSNKSFHELNILYMVLYL